MIPFNNKIALMNRTIARQKDVLLQEGSLFPNLILFKKGEPIFVEEEDTKGIILVHNSSPSDTLPQANYTDDGETIYVTNVIFEIGDDFTAKDIYRVTKDLVKKYHPDMVGFVMLRVYSEYGQQGLPLHMDPDSVKILNSVFYTDKERDGMAMLVPYIFGGELPLDKKKPANGVHDNINYDITFIDSGWTTTKNNSIRSPFRNPFFGR
jgi:hypothetical protein